LQELSPYFIERTMPPSSEFVQDDFAYEPQGRGIRDYWAVIAKRKALIATFLLAALIITGTYVELKTPIYTADTIILIERQRPQVLEMKDLLAEAPAADEHDYYKTQYEILRSRSLAGEVIRDLDLNQEPAFKGATGSSHGLTQMLKWARAQIFPARPVERHAHEASQPAVPGVDFYLSNLNVKAKAGTRLVSVSFSSSDPVLAARVADAHVSGYIRRGMELYAQAGEDAQRFLQAKLVELKERVEKSEAALNAYRRDRGIVALSLDDSDKINFQRLSDLSKAFTQAEEDRIGLESQVQLLRQGQYDALPQVINSALIQNLKAEAARTEADYAKLSNQFKPDYPPLAQLASKLSQTHDRITRESQSIVSGIRSAYATAMAREKSIRGALEAEKNRTLALNDASLQDAILAREVDSNRELYKNVLERMKQMGVASEVRVSNVSVVDKAEVPGQVSSPKKFQSLALAELLALLIGVGLAFGLEALDNALKSPEDVEHYLRLPTLGLVPDFGKMGARLPQLKHANGIAAKASSNGVEAPASRELVGVLQPFSIASEGYRTIRTSVLLSRAGEPPKTILLTSVTSEEGKTCSSTPTCDVRAATRCSTWTMIVD
jgi:uncharacterized protein involved in exopolysaccharide biosynthesis